jgi:hypothetical protein
VRPRHGDARTRSLRSDGTGSLEDVHELLVPAGDLGDGRFSRRRQVFGEPPQTIGLPPVQRPIPFRVVADEDLAEGRVERLDVPGEVIAVFEVEPNDGPGAPQIFQAAGFASDLTALAATAGIGVINVLATFIAIWLVDREGRKPLLIAGVTGMVATLVVLGLAFQGGSARTGTGSLGYITVTCLAGYIIFFAFSLGPIVWLMISEIYPLRNRAQAMAVSTASNWGANFLVSTTFPVMALRLGSAATFFTYAGLGVLTLLFVIAKVPETKGKTLEEISKMWR